MKQPWLSPSHVAVVIAALLAAYGIYARFLAADEHPVYAMWAWVMAGLWLGLAWVSRKGTRP
jgi:hypothetical protein